MEQLNESGQINGKYTGLISLHSTLTAERAAEPLLHSDAVSLHMAAIQVTLKPRGKHEAVHEVTSDLHTPGSL